MQLGKLRLNPVASKLRPHTDWAWQPGVSVLCSRAEPPPTAPASALLAHHTAPHTRLITLPLPHTGQSGSSASILEMKEVPGGSKPLRRWEYYYWGLGATGVSFLLYNRLKEPEKSPEEIEVSCEQPARACAELYMGIMWRCAVQLCVCACGSQCGSAALCGMTCCHDVLKAGGLQIP